MPEKAAFAVDPERAAAAAQVDREGSKGDNDGDWES
jgi:hypothetical protein